MQKWILIESNKRDWNYFIRLHIFKDFFKFELLSKRASFRLASESRADYKQKRNKISVIISRSLKRLGDRGLIEAMMGHKFSNIDLTAKGREVVKLLINASFSKITKVNNKTGIYRGQ